MFHTRFYHQHQWWWRQQRHCFIIVSDSVISCVLLHGGISLIPNLQVYYLQEYREGSHSLCELYPLTNLVRLNLFIEPHKSHHHNKVITQGENKDDFFFATKLIVFCFVFAAVKCALLIPFLLPMPQSVQSVTRSQNMLVWYLFVINIIACYLLTYRKAIQSCISIMVCWLNISKPWYCSYASFDA